MFCHVAGFDGVSAVGGRFPLPAFLRACLAGDQGHLVRNHEGRIEAHAELTDQVLHRGVGLHFLAGSFFRFFGDLVGFFQFGKKLFGAGLGDGADVFDDLFFRHADTVVGDGQRFSLFIGSEADHKLAVPFQQLAVGEGSETQLVDGVAGVGDQLTQKDLVVGVDRIDHQVQQLFGLRLKLKFFFCNVFIFHGGNSSFYC